MQKESAFCIFPPTAELVKDFMPDAFPDTILSTFPS